MGAVDVVVPCYNYSRYLEASVGSILRQEGVDVRVLIIDDCSSDDTPAVGRRLAAADGRVEFRRHEKNRGHIATYNEGLLEWASAEYSVLLSADDALAPGALARATRLMNAHRDLGMTYGMAVVIVDDDVSGPAPEGASDESRILPSPKFLQHCFEHANPVPTPSAVVRTELQHRLGGYRAEYPHAGDLEMWMRFASQAPIGVVHSVQAFYRWHTSNMSHQHYGQLTSDLHELAAVGSDVLARCVGRFPEAGTWPELLARSLAKRAVSSASSAFNGGHMDECRARLRFAQELWPGVRSSAGWWRLSAKRLLGPSIWKGLQPAINRVRGAAVEDGGGRPRLWRGLQMGWWPG